LISNLQNLKQKHKTKLTHIIVMVKIRSPQFRPNINHLKILKKGVDFWNQWRLDKPLIKPNLFSANLHFQILHGANFSGVNLVGADLSETDLSDANLRGAILFGANLGEAILRGADLSGAELMKANLRGADLSGATLIETNLVLADLSKVDLQQANLRGANLSMTRLIEVKLSRATLSDCNVYGISVWGVTGLEKAEQSNLIITTHNEPVITVDNLEVAQFVYLMLHSEKIRDVINTIGQKGVLILGRFGERKPILEAIRAKLREIGYVPIIFDFTNPTNRDFTETIMTLAGMSRFIIAEITKPKSVILELKTIVPNYMIPMVTIIEKGESPFSMFKDLWIQYKDYVLEPLTYDSIEQLQRVFKKAIIDPANCRLDILRKQKAEEMCIRDASDYEK
jgi:uncharacterized protein YjbI with pentapeptide repeats